MDWINLSDKYGPHRQEKNELKTYITFGQVHRHALGDMVFDKDSVAVIECESAAAGRERAVELFGKEFSSSYFEDQFKSHFPAYFPRGLIEVEEKV